MAKIKVSIRVNILTIFAVLLISIGSLIILVNYYAGNTILLRFAEKMIVIANDNLDQQITTALTPIYERIHFGSNSIKNGLIRPVPSLEFTKLLLQLLEDQPTYAGAHWSQPDGSFNFIDRDNKGGFTHGLISCIKQQCTEITQQLDKNGQILNQTPPQIVNYDPHTRPWYIKTVNAKHFTLSDLYTFYSNPGLGLTAANPLYDANNNLYGILSIDLRLQALSEFVANLKLTQNANIFIFTSDNVLIASKILQNYSGNTVPKISDIEVPWVAASIKHYQKTGQKLFVYKHNGQQYLAYYDDIQSIIGSHWYIATILPVKDITAALTQTLTNSALLAIALLLVGIFLVSLVSKTISRPIVRLTKDAQLINNLELDKVKYDKLSHIKEISFLQEAFIAMKQSLSSFIRYVPFTLVKKLTTTGDIAHVGGENKEVTFLFLDIQGFTTISENMEPQALTKYLSEYFDIMTKTILAHQGTLDKYIGDAIMAFWGAPADDIDHPLHACQCAIAILHELEILNLHWQQAQKPTMKIRIGIHTGNAVIGNVGSNDRLSYTAIGDSVNLASRLESLNKIYGTTIIVSATTYLLTKNNYTFRLLDNVSVRGKNIGGYIYELIENTHKLNKYNITEYNNNFIQAFIAYQKGNWDIAISLFTYLANLYPDDELIKMYLDRCLQFKSNPPTNWQGIWRLT